MSAPIIILVRPQLGENIGKAARAMLNFGLTEMRLVAPRDGWPNPTAGPAASGADVVLERAQVFETLGQAVADINHVYATTVRKRGVTKPVLTPAEAATEIMAAPGQSAILFGAERSGLDMDEVALARTIITVPINPEFGSLNLAQAVILCAYEWSKHQSLVSPPRIEIDPPAPQDRTGWHDRTSIRPAGRTPLFPPARARRCDAANAAQPFDQARLEQPGGPHPARRAECFRQTTSQSGLNLHGLLPYQIRH